MEWVVEAPSIVPNPILGRSVKLYAITLLRKGNGSVV